MRDRISKLTPFHVSLRSIYTIGLNSIELVYGGLHCVPEGYCFVSLSLCTIENNFPGVPDGPSAPQKKRETDTKTETDSQRFRSPGRVAQNMLSDLFWYAC